jgi:hypothetical protein
MTIVPVLRRFALCLALLLATLAPSSRADVKVLYESNFEKTDADKVPDDLLVIDGGFAVKLADGKKVLELPGSPLDSYGVLFGPSMEAGITISAKIAASRQGRRFPTFGLGVNGVSGYRLQISPAKDAVEFFHGDDSVAAHEFKWKSGEWYSLKVRITKSGDKYTIEGKAWLASEAEPAEWILTATESNKLPAGRPSVWGKPFSGTPIRFNDLKVTQGE